MEEIRDINKHLLCMADPYQGILEHVNGRERIVIHLPVGGEVTFFKGNNCTVVYRKSVTLFCVNWVRLNAG